MNKVLIVAIFLVVGFVSANNVRNTPAELARYVIANSDWVAVGSKSTADGELKGYPFVNIKSVADGGIGHPYVLLSELDRSVMDWNINSQASMLATFAGERCEKNGWGAQDPRCPRLILVGNIGTLIAPGEEDIARAALFAKHPEMENWLNAPDHSFFFAKLYVKQVFYRDGNHGTGIDIDVNEYFKADPSKVESIF